MQSAVVALLDQARQCLSCSHCRCRHITSLRLTLDFSRPSHHEVVFLTIISLMVSCYFLSQAIMDSIFRESSIAIISDAVGSAIDVGSTIVIFVRFMSPYSLAASARNAAIEARISVMLLLLMVLLGLGEVWFAMAHVASQATPTHTAIGLEVSISFPSAVLYLLIGMLQLHVGWSLRQESLVADGLISLFGALTALAGLLDALVNLLTAVPLTITKPPYYTTSYPYYWLADAFGIIIGMMLVFAGWRGLRHRLRGGAAWLEAKFWCQELPPPTPGVDAPLERSCDYSYGSGGGCGSCSCSGGSDGSGSCGCGSTSSTNDGNGDGLVCIASNVAGSLHDETTPLRSHSSTKDFMERFGV